MNNKAWMRSALAAAALFVMACFETDPTAAPVAGTATTARCSSYVSATATACAGWYCGTTAASIEAFTFDGAACGGDPDLVCSGTTSETAASCARQLKASNPLDTSEQLRSKVQACVAREAAPRVNASCLNCYVENELCVQSACVTECLAGNNPSCDSCRRSSGCERSFYACAGLPSPF